MRIKHIMGRYVFIFKLITICLIILYKNWCLKILAKNIALFLYTSVEDAVKDNASNCHKGIGSLNDKKWHNTGFSFIFTFLFYWFYHYIVLYWFYYEIIVSDICILYPLYPIFRFELGAARWGQDEGRCAE